MIRGRPVRIWFLLPLLAVVGACSDSSTEPAAPMSSGVFVLNSTGQTLASFSVLEGLEVGAPPTDLGAGFDGDAFDLTTSFAVTTVSAFGGSRLLFVDLASGDVLTTSFPAPQSDLTNPSAASFDPQGTAWVGGRSSDAIYRAIPGDLTAVRVASGVGTFIERVVPHGDRLYVIDANIDDDAGSYEPLGPGRVVVLSRVGAEEQVIDLPPAALNPTEAVVTEGALLVLASGTFDPTTFLPASDGSLVAVDLATGVGGTPGGAECQRRINGVGFGWFRLCDHDNGLSDPEPPAFRSGQRDLRSRAGGSHTRQGRGWWTGRLLVGHGAQRRPHRVCHVQLRRSRTSRADG